MGFLRILFLLFRLAACVSSLSFLPFGVRGVKSPCLRMEYGGYGVNDDEWARW